MIKKVIRQSRKIRIGRPSLSQGGTTPFVTIRFPTQLREQCERAAERSGLTFSEWLRFAARAQLFILEKLGGAE